MYVIFPEGERCSDHIYDETDIVILSEKKLRIASPLKILLAAWYWNNGFDYFLS